MRHTSQPDNQKSNEMALIEPRYSKMDWTLTQCVCSSTKFIFHFVSIDEFIVFIRSSIGRHGAEQIITRRALPSDNLNGSNLPIKYNNREKLSDQNVTRRFFNKVHLPHFRLAHQYSAQDRMKASRRRRAIHAGRIITSA